MNVVIIGSTSIRHQPTSALFITGSIFLYVFSYYALRLGFFLESLFVPLHVARPMGDSLLGDRVYRSYMLTILEYNTQVGLIVLEMVDFDVILGMDWFPLYHAILNCFAKTVTLAIPYIPPIVW